MSTDADANIIQGNPTKTFFIEMITRDISIKDAILDLLDNSIDGANRINSENYSGLFIEITINKDEFIVKDNCGGFSLETAQKYAFRFGRPDDAPATIGSVGRFGVGMKRALFKMGLNFEVETKTDENHFQIDVDVKQWKNKKKTINFPNNTTSEIEDWDFTYKDIDANTCNLSENGTFIRLNNLYKEVSSFFEEESFLNDLIDEIERLLNFSLEKGIKITLNDRVLAKKGIVIFNDESTPYYFEGNIDQKVKFRVIAGLSYVGDPTSSGWYIYCNDRLVVEADQSEITGWKTGSIPKFHTDYVMFKGVVFLDSDEPINLPLTTTKKGIDASSDVYKKVLFYMKEAMNNVLGFLKEVRKLDDANDYRKTLGEQEDKISVIELKTIPITTSRSFKSPTLAPEVIAQKKENIRISFNVPKKLVEIAKNHSNVSNTNQLGQYVFDYYLKMEELQDE